MKGIERRTSGGLMLALVLAGAVAVWAQSGGLTGPSGDAQGEFPGSTEPSEKAVLSLNIQGSILQAPVKDGDRVKKGQLLLKLDDQVEQKRLEAMELEAKSSLPVEFAKTDLAAKEVDLARKQDLFEKKVGSQTEVDEARLARDLAGIKVKQAAEDQQKKLLEAEQQKMRIQQMTLLSPFDAVVEKRYMGVGELAVPDPNKPLITVVQNDPLKVTVYLPTKVAGRLTIGDVIQVRHEAETQWESAKVTVLSPVADAGSGMRLVNLELSNAKNRESGQQVWVKVPEKLAGQAPAP